MLETLNQLLEQHRESLVTAAGVLLVLVLTVVSVSLFKRYLKRTGQKHHFAERRTNAISKLGQTLIFFVSLVILSNVIGFGIQGIFVATSSLFALIGIAFFANWSILSNITASVLIYFTFPFRIGDRLIVDHDPKYQGVLKDVTLFYLKIQNDLGSDITIPANVAIQKIITIQSQSDWEKWKKAEVAAERALAESQERV